MKNAVNVEPKLLNLGCGHRFKPGWFNLDMSPQNEIVIKHDLTQPLPFADNFFDLIYHSHLLEHLAQSQGLALMTECYRVLKPNGVIRVVVPDLEELVRSYLEELEKALADDSKAGENLKWLHLELYDQLVREFPDGEFGYFFAQPDVPNRNFIIQRMGACARYIFEYREQEKLNLASQQIDLKPKLKSKVKKFVKHFMQSFNFKQLVFKLILGKEYRYYEIGRFRMSGEVHKCMYDRYTLSQLLQHIGFTNICVTQPEQSHSEFWHPDGLDVESSGEVYHANSLFMEAVKPDVDS